MLYFFGDIEINPGPKQSSLTFCHWNLNSVAAREYIKVSLLQGYITECSFDIICLSKNFLNSSPDIGDDRLKIEGYNLIRSDHPSGSKKKEAFVFTIRNIFLLLEGMISVL